MSTKRHLNSKKRYVDCRATKRACRYAGTDIPAHKYEQLVANNDIRTKPSLTKKEEANLPNYYRQAKDEYDLAVQKEDEYKKALQEFELKANKIREEYGIPEGYTPTYNMDAEKEQIRKSLIEHYVAAGVNRRKAEYIVDDIEKATPHDYKAIIKQRGDRYDPDLKAHTAAAAESIENNTELQNKISNYSQKAKTLDNFVKSIVKIDAQRYDFMREKGLSSFSGSYSSATEQAASKLGEKHDWVKAGIKDIQEVGQITNVTPDKISVDKEGSFNNLWVQHGDGTLERIKSYTPPENEGYGTHGGNLVTESGKTLTSFRHYHSFNRGGSINNASTKIIVEKKDGKNYSHPNWRLYGEIDSGD